MPFELANIRYDDPLQRARAEAFLLEHPDPDVRIRPRETLDRAMETGQGVALSRESGPICGLSLIYHYEIMGIDRLFAEVGTMIIAPSERGYGLQTFVAKFHLIQIYLEEIHAAEGDIFAVVSPGTPSEHNLTAKVQMKSWAPPSPLQLVRRTHGVPFSTEKRVIRADLEAIRAAFADLRAWHREKNIFSTPKGGELIRIRAEWFSPGVLALSP